ncbi:MAG: hypothetical protein ACJ8G4_22245 [Burkholderiales bacterium]
MQKPVLLAAATLLSLAACNPADSVSDAHAESRAVSAVALLWSAPAADAQDREVYEYH